MPDINDMGIENVKRGICGFTSTLYALYDNQPQLRNRLGGALGGQHRSTRLMAEIKTFLQMMKADGNQAVLNDITELTRTFAGYGGWSVHSYIATINELKDHDFSIAMPPGATVEYMRVAWDMKPILTNKVVPGAAILGLTKKTGAPQNRWNNLAHYVYQSASGRIYSWGEQFDDLQKLNITKQKDYLVVYRIMV